MRTIVSYGAVLLAVLATSCSGGGSSIPAPSSQAPTRSGPVASERTVLYVANQTPPNGSLVITEYATSADGNVAPLTSISQRAAIAVDMNGNLNLIDGRQVEKYLPGSNVPFETDTFPVNSGQIVGAAFDRSNHVYVAVLSYGGPPCTQPTQVVIQLSQRGDEYVIDRVIWGTMQSPYAIAVDRNGYIYVADQEQTPGNPVFVFAPNANGQSKPYAELRALDDRLLHVAVAADGTVYADSYTDNSIDIFSPIVSGNPQFIGRIAGAATGLSRPSGIGVDQTTGDVFVANADSDSVVRFSPGASGNVAPASTIAGPATGIAFPIDIAL